MQIGCERRLLTGVAADMLPRPRGRFGCVRAFDGNAGFSGKTPERGYGEFRRATKTMRMADTRALRLPLAGLPQFADAAFDQIPFQHAEVLDEQDAISGGRFRDRRRERAGLRRASHTFHP